MAMGFLPRRLPRSELQAQFTPEGSQPQMRLNDFRPGDPCIFVQVKYVLSRIDLTMLTVLN